MKRGLSGGSCRDTREYDQEFVKCIVCDRLYPVLTTDGGKDFICDQHKRLDPEAYHIARVSGPDDSVEEIEATAAGLQDQMNIAMTELREQYPGGVTEAMGEEFRLLFIEKAMRYLTDKKLIEADDE